MKEVQKLCFLVFGLFLFCLIFYFFDRNEILEIKHEQFKKSIYFGIIILSFFSIVFNFLSLDGIKLKILFSILPIIAVIQILSFGIINTFLSASAWKTQTIIYQNKFDDSKKVEFQMLDKGALGYRRRTVEINYITNWLFISSPYTEEIFNSDSDWKKVDKEINELGLK